MSERTDPPPTQERLGYLNIWVLVRHHRHGVDVWPVRAETEAALPEPEDYIALQHATHQPKDEGEYTEWHGPFEVKV